MFEKLAEYGHEKIILCSKPKVGLKAIIAIHSTVLGPAFGGCRIRKYQREEDALTDVMRLSRGMTLKMAAANLGVGGGKSVIIADPLTEKTPELLVAFAECVESLGGLYYTAEDAGVTVADLNMFCNHTRFAVGGEKSPYAHGDPSKPTAYGAYLGIKAGVEIKLGRKELAGVKVAVQGVGKVGFRLVEMLADDGAIVTVSDVVEERVTSAVESFGVTAVDPEAIYDVDCDVFSPAGFGGSINKETIPRFKAKLIAGAANNQLLEEETDSLLLTKRDIYFIPDFIVSCGGATMGVSETRKIPYDEAFKKIDNVTANVFEIDSIAKKRGITTTQAAIEMAYGRIEAAKKK